MPKGYQTTQLAAPVVGAGRLRIALAGGGEREVRIHHAHLEEDAGKSLHEEFPGASGIDLNRAGTPLLEIVCEPDLRSGPEAVALLRQIHALATYLEISDGDMSQGSMRCDVNVSVRPAGDSALGTRTEMKNLNSFRFVERAIEGEAARQIALIEEGGKVVQETRLYDSEANLSRPMRGKEMAHDYRYFPCPDLLPVIIDEAFIAAERDALPELPAACRERLMREHGLSVDAANLLTAERATVDYFEQVAAVCSAGKMAANWVNGELAAQLNKTGGRLADCPVSAAELGRLIARILDGSLSGKLAKTVFADMWAGRGGVDAIIAARGLQQVRDSGAIEALVDKVLAENAAQVENYRTARPEKRGKMLGFFVGQAMKLSGGKAAPGEVNRLLREKL